MVCLVWLWIKPWRKVLDNFLRNEENFYNKKIFFKFNANEIQYNSEIDIWLLILNIYHDTEYFEICAFSWINKNNREKKLWIIFKEIKKILHKKNIFWFLHLRKPSIDIKCTAVQRKKNEQHLFEYMIRPIVINMTCKRTCHIIFV